MNRNIHEGRILIGLLAMAAALVIGLTLTFAWWLPVVMAGAYAVAYVIGAILIKVFDL